MSGQTGHFACTACGRGYANTDDAEECFERCLARMKPNAQFEQALRRVQVRYVQRLQAHGVRSLQRIDPYSEHTKMLNTLTQEQAAMGRPVAKPDPVQSQGSKAVQSTSTATQASATDVVVKDVQTTPVDGSPIEAANFSEAQEEVYSSANAQTAQALDESVLAAGEEESLTADLHITAGEELSPNELNQEFTQDEVLDTGENEVAQEFTQPVLADSDPEVDTNIMDELPTEYETASAALPDAEEENAMLAANALSVLDKIAASANRKAAKPAPQQKPPARREHTRHHAAQSPMDSLDNTSTLPATTDLLDETPSSADFTSMLDDSLQMPSDEALNQSFVAEPSSAAMSLLNQKSFAKAESPGRGDSGSALTMLATSTPEATHRALGSGERALSANRDKDSFDFDMSMGGGDLSGAFSEASEFAQVAEQPETNVLAADVLALLQTSTTDENLELSSKQTKELKSKKIEVDLDLLEKLTTDDGSANDGTVHLRKADMKSYRRNNAKYTCSACSKEFFTKEQVEACFYSHPEEGSEEARALIERAKKTSNKTAA
jgi:hypothetical protein